MTGPGKAILDLPVERAVAHIAIGHLDAATEAVRRVGRPRDAEALHDFRVAVRRTRTLLRAYSRWLGKASRRKTRRRLGELGRLTNAGRDAEVQIVWLEGQRDRLARKERAGLNWLLRLLRETKRAGYASTRGEVREQFDRVDTLIRSRLAQYAPDEPVRFRLAFGTLLQEHAVDLAKRLRRIRSAGDRAGIHAARLSVKRLRYLVEPAAAALADGKAVVRQLKALQELLGTLNDLHVVAGTLATALKRVSKEKARQLHDLALAGNHEELARERRRDERLGLVTLAGVARQQRDTLFAELEGGWLERHAAEFTDALARDGAALVSADVHEIERKYLLSGLPERAHEGAPAEIEQGWLPGKKLRERLRCVRSNGTERWFRTVKLGSGITRTELEEETTGELFAALWPHTEGCRVRKRRYAVREGKAVWEIDEFLDRELFLAEIELPHEDAAVTIPEWLAPYLVREVTGEDAFVNLNLAR